MSKKSGSWTDFRKVDRLVRQTVRAGMLALGTDVKKRGVILAAKDSGDLRNSAEVEVSASGETVSTSFNTDYAKRRHYENNLHPATRLYLTQALKSITNLGRYFTRFN